ncbi:MAG: cysteate synthase [Bacteroidetes bacterium]|uniref:Cysteate synthase n=1 Tax=Candidatus Cryptobacteroides excrementipullorum TaxID=2840761 RepID=A0A9D9IUU7_9BACT|nr:cysteate synthase [Candidatus Cryptobacteroides excrementipullorum]
MNCATGRIFEDAGWTLSDPECETPAMVRAVYENRKFEIRDDLDGFYRFAQWLPVKRTLKHSHAPVTYKSKGLGHYLGLENLYITFSGYFPEIGACMETCSFKETEAYSVCARLPEKHDRILVVASAGNTARAFAKVCSDNNIPLLLSVPEDNMGALWFHRPLNDCVKIIAAPAGCDYFDAIVLADKVCQSDRFMAEGGAKNIARRDGMGTTLLSAVEVTGRIPDAYFQAIGSGTGTIAVWENNLRLIEDGRFGTHKMRLYPSQNAPFTIMYDSWKAGSRALVHLSAEDARRQASEIKAKVLSNRKPPYSLAGGLFDALSDAGGNIYKVTNSEIDEWKARFKELEGIDIYSAASVAVASLSHAVAEKAVGNEEVIMLNITGGGESLTKEHHDVVYARPDMVIDTFLPAEQIIRDVERLF